MNLRKECTLGINDTPDYHSAVDWKNGKAHPGYPGDAQRARAARAGVACDMALSQQFGLPEIRLRTKAPDITL